MPRLRFFFSPLILLLATALNGAEISFDEYNGRPVAEIRFEGNEDVGEDVLCNELTFGEGNLLKDKHLRKATESLLELGKFDSADVVVSEGDQGLIITFQLVEKWHVMSAWGLGVDSRSPYACKARLDATKLAELEGMTIEQIHFEGNKTTREIILREELLFDIGDLFTVKNLIRSRQSIKNLSLFKMVWARAERGDSGVIVTFTVTEKWYVLPIPTLSRNTDGDISYGGELTWDNVFGLNQSAKLEIEQEDQADGETEQHLSLDYDVPKIPGTIYGFSSGIKRQRTLTESEDEFGNTLGEFYDYIDSLDLAASRWIKRTAPSQGWIGAVGIQWNRNYQIASSGQPDLLDDYRVLNLAASGGFVAVNDHEYYRSGQEFGGDIGLGRKTLGSTEDYTFFGAFWRLYQPIHVPFWSNINMQLRGGYNLGQEDVFELSGSDTMRGMLDDSAPIGEIFGLLNLNWLIPIPRYPAFRWNIFSDVGNAWPRGEVNLLDWKYTVGVGVRWKIRALVNTSLRLDIGLNPNTGERKAYVGTSYMF
jgi:outer membrane protein assembly factor BamA